MAVLRASSSDLADLASGFPQVVETTQGKPIGARLIRYLGGGGMSAVGRRIISARKTGRPSWVSASRWTGHAWWTRAAGS
jgi:hypothetical protein